MATLLRATPVTQFSSAVTPVTVTPVMVTAKRLSHAARSAQEPEGGVFDPLQGPPEVWPHLPLHLHPAAGPAAGHHPLGGLEVSRIQQTTLHQQTAPSTLHQQTAPDHTTFADYSRLHYTSRLQHTTTFADYIRPHYANRLQQTTLHQQTTADHTTQVDFHLIRLQQTILHQKLQQTTLHQTLHQTTLHQLTTTDQTTTAECSKPHYTSRIQ